MTGVNNLLLAYGSATAAAYTGPGDIVASALAWWGLRGYSAAYSTGSNAAIDIVDSGSANAATINILSTGSLDNSTLNTWIVAHGTAYIVKFYDQSGNGVHLTCIQALAPKIAQSILGSQPAAQYNQTQAIGNTTGINQAQPYTIVYSANRTTAFRGGNNSVLYGPSGFPQAGSGADDTAFAFSGALISGTATDSSFHALIDTYNNGSSEVYVDGSAVASGSTGSGSFSSPGSIYLGCFPAGSNVFGGYISECGIWASTFSSGNKTSMNSNIHTYWGY